MTFNGLQLRAHIHVTWWPVISKKVSESSWLLSKSTLSSCCSFTKPSNSPKFLIVFVQDTKSTSEKKTYICIIRNIPFMYLSSAMITNCFAQDATIFSWVKHPLEDISTTVKSTVFLHIHPHMYVVVQFYPWFNFYFPLFFLMLIYDNEYKTKENKNWTKDKIELQHIHQSVDVLRV